MPSASSSHLCAHALPPLVMTTALNADSPFSRARDRYQRRRWAEVTLWRWMNRTSLAVVVVDATVRSVRSLDFLSKFGPSSRLELLVMPSSKQPLTSGQTKGYLEAQQILYAASGASQLLRGCSHFAHATGNRFIANAEPLLRSSAIRRCTVGIVKSSSTNAIRWRGPGRPWVDSSFVVWTSYFLRRYFNAASISEQSRPSNPFEVVLGRAVLAAHKKGEHLAWFACLHIIGWSGTRGTRVHNLCRVDAGLSIKVTHLQANGHFAVSDVGPSTLPGSTDHRHVRATASELAHAPSVAAIHPTGRSVGRGTAPDCSSLVPPIDPSPIRSPQAVHTAMLPYIAGKELLEIGTRNGDGMMCFARFAKSAVAVEMDLPYCAKLRQRSTVLMHTTSRNFSTRCARYQDDTPDADVYTWWQAVPRLRNEAVLSHLGLLQREGRIRASAEAVVLFDESHGPDLSSLRRLHRHFRWSERVRFDEFALCLHLLPPGHPDRRWCKRARGIFTVGGLIISIKYN